MTYQRRLCAFTNTPISHVDRAAVQLSFAKLNADGRMTGENIILDCSGEVRRRGRIDELLVEKMREFDE